MNKYQEALQVMKSNNERIVDKARIFVDKYDENPFVVLQELVDKETPMKVVEKWEDSTNYEQFHKCPKCKDIVVRVCLYCPFCGQHLDWSEE